MLLENVVPFRGYRFLQSLKYLGRVPYRFIAHEHFLATTKGERYELVFALRWRFVL